MIGSSLVHHRIPSPNFGDRRNQAQITSIIVHYTAMADDDAALSWLCNKASNVSCHYFVAKDGTITQLVSEDKRAWHAGVSAWHQDTDLNSSSIGLELAHSGDFSALQRPQTLPKEPAFPLAQIAATIALCQDIITRYGIKAPYVLAHSDIAPLRKQDPGEFFPWDGLANAGVGHYTQPEPITQDNRPLNAAERREFLAGLARYGYHISQAHTDDEITKIIIAFQRHFRPERVDGIADLSSFKTLRQLLATLPQMN